MSAAELPATFRRKTDVGEPVDCPHCKAVGYAGVPTKDGRVLAVLCPTCEGRGTVLVLSALPVSPEELAKARAEQNIREAREAAKR